MRGKQRSRGREKEEGAGLVVFSRGGWCRRRQITSAINRFWGVVSVSRGLVSVSVGRVSKCVIVRVDVGS